MKLQLGSGSGLGSVALLGAGRCRMSKLFAGRGSRFIHRWLKSAEESQVEAVMLFITASGVRLPASCGWHSDPAQDKHLEMRIPGCHVGAWLSPEAAMR